MTAPVPERVRLCGHRLAWRDEYLDAPRTWCMMAPGNGAWQRAAAAADYRSGLKTIYKGEPVLIFTRGRMLS